MAENKEQQPLAGTPAERLAARIAEQVRAEEAEARSERARAAAQMRRARGRNKSTRSYEDD